MDGRLSITRVFREVGSGCSRSLYVLADDGNEYQAKGELHKFRHVATNELVAVRLAKRLGLSVRDHAVLARGRKLYFGSRWMAPGSFHPTVSEDLLNMCTNNESAYELAVFDTWICNQDRHEGNLIALCSGAAAPGKFKICPAITHLMVATDHDGAFLSDNREPSQFVSQLTNSGVAEYVQLPWVRKSVINPTRLGLAIQKAESVSRDELSSIVHSVPEELLPKEDAGQWIDFLVSRRDGLRALFERHRGLFYSLNAGAI